MWVCLAQIGGLQAGLSIASTEAGWRILSELTLLAGSALCTESQISLHQLGTYLSSSPLLPLHRRGLIVAHAQAAGDKRKWFEEKQQRKDAELDRLGLGSDQVLPKLDASSKLGFILKLR